MKIRCTETNKSEKEAGEQNNATKLEIKVESGPESKATLVLN